MRHFTVKNFERFQHYKDRAPPWIKLYNELLDDYEFGALPDASKLHLIAIWLLASRSENKIPYDPAWVARRINANSKVDLELLRSSGFIVLDQELHSTEHVASIALAESEQDACPEKRERESREEKNSCANEFELFWKAYPRRDGANPKGPAKKLFEKAVKGGVPADIIIAAARRCAFVESKNVGTPYIPQAIKWLRDERWGDYEQAPDLPETNLIEVTDDNALRAWDEYEMKRRGKRLPRNRAGGWLLPSKFPPGYEENIIAGVRNIIKEAAA